MAGETYYAWSVFNTEVDEWGKPHSRIMPGEKITASDLDISDDEFDGLVEVGSIRTEEYPDVEEGQSPAEYYRAEANAALELVMSPTGVVEEVPPPEPDESATAKSGTMTAKSSGDK